LRTMALTARRTVGPRKEGPRGRRLHSRLNKEGKTRFSGIPLTVPSQTGYKELARAQRETLVEGKSSIRCAHSALWKVALYLEGDAGNESPIEEGLAHG